MIKAIVTSVMIGLGASLLGRYWGEWGVIPGVILLITGLDLRYEERHDST